MIMVRVSQGLGNQMFQYAFGECLSKKQNKEIFYDTSFIADRISGRPMRSVNDIFVKPFYHAALSQIRRCSGRFVYHFPVIYDWMRGKEEIFSLYNGVTWKFRNKRKCKLIQEPDYWNIPERFSDEIMNMTLEDNCNYYFNGFWESVRYIERERPFLQQRFKLCVEEKRMEGYLTQISSTNSVAVHIRRGDYIVKSNEDIRFNICGDSYYKEAVKTVKETVNNPVFFIFSDDMSFARGLFQKEENCVYVENNRDFEDLFLMSRCRHNIIANSTFSFWGAFLNQGVNQMVVAPKVHYQKNVKGEWKKIQFPVLKEWIVLENEA